MGFKIMTKATLVDWVESLRNGYRVFGPHPLEDRYIFNEIRSADELALDYTNTILPPKKVLLPPYEEVIRFERNGDDHAEVVLDSQPTVVLGVHTCDMHAIALLDRVFSQGFADQHYLSRRENTILVSIECLAPCSEDSFCKSMGTFVVPENYDLHLTDLGDEYAIDVGSEKGAALLEDFDAVRDAEDVDYRRMNQVLSEKWPRFPYRLEFDVTELPDLLSLSYRSTLWDQVGEKCLGCGMCTIICPTCYCFNVVDEVDLTLNAGRRLRVWDSCQLDQFATVAGGHNFRSSQAARQRHRFLHKGKYQTEATGMVGCVGCGRCAQACLVGITPVEILNGIYQRHGAAIKNH